MQLKTIKNHLPFFWEKEETKSYQRSGVNLSIPRPESEGLPFDKFKALSKAKGLEVHPEPRLHPYLSPP
jgi:hypothetical protein